MFELVFVAVAASVRLTTLVISMRNEKRLLASGAVEHGAKTSKAIAAAHIGFYLAAIAEGALRDAPFTRINELGLVVYTLSILVLFWVIATLGKFWTVKIYIAPDHRLSTNWLFRLVRHPNYYLNIIPELIGFALVLQAYVTLIVGLPIYLVILAMRIRQEERAMRQHFPQY